MRFFTAANVLNVFIAMTVASILESNPAYKGMTEAGYGALILASIIDLPLLFTIPIAVFCRNVSGAIFLIAISNLIFRIVLANVTGQGDFIEIAVFSQVFIGLLIQRSIAYWRQRPLIEIQAQENWFYTKTGIAAIDWAWRERVQDAVNMIACKLDMVSIPLVLLGITLSFTSSKLGGLFIVTNLYVILWLVLLIFAVWPLVLLEEVFRFFFSLSKTDRPREVTKSAMKGASKIKDNLQKSEAPDRVKSWFKNGVL
ncbi:MAG: hypothetical protein LRY76_07085 [Alphaproteobacteria bacterium]|nr:hypothetical protein [Alphaproteobacteria bacterium]